MNNTYKIRLVEDFFWLILTDVTTIEELYGIHNIDLYILSEGGTERLIRGQTDILYAISRGLDIGYELGKFSLFKTKLRDLDSLINK